MAEEPESYQSMRSHADVHTFVVCYADRFYVDVPYHVRRKGPWNGTGRGDVVKLKPKNIEQRVSQSVTIPVQAFAAWHEPSAWTTAFSAP